MLHYRFQNLVLTIGLGSTILRYAPTLAATSLVSINSTTASSLSTTILNATNPIVDLGYAKYQGHINPSTGNTEFLGVRFARAPIGELRWKEPQLPLKSNSSEEEEEVIVADVLPDRCIGTTTFGLADSSPFVDGGSILGRGDPGKMMNTENLLKRSVIVPPGMNEDCLFLNVYVPGILDATTSKRTLPVIVWIHGGGYSRGSASGTSNTDFFDGNDLIRESPSGSPVVVVVIQYRLGLFGFLAGNEVGARGALNAGLLDQQFALRWVHEHIHTFGGNPDHVVVWGQSAGASSSIQHMLANGGNTQPKLLKTIISSSDFLLPQHGYNDPIPEQLFSLVAERAGCAETSDKLSCLRSAPIDLLIQINNDITLAGFYGTFTFVPVVDGKFISKRTSELLKEGKFNGVDVLMANTNSFEGIHFVNASNPLPLDIYIKNLFPTLQEGEVQQATDLYGSIREDPSGNETVTLTNQAIAVYGEAILICPTYWLLQAFNGKAYKSEFAIPPGDHITDVPYYWPSQGDGPAFKNPAFDTAFSSSFLNFAVVQDPANSGTPTWSRWSSDNGGSLEMLFNQTEAGLPLIKSVQTDKNVLERCRYWESVSHLTGQ